MTVAELKGKKRPKTYYRLFIIVMYIIVTNTSLLLQMQRELIRNKQAADDRDGVCSPSSRVVDRTNDR